MKFFRDGIDLEIDKAPNVSKTRDGHVVEEYLIDGVKHFFVTLAGLPYCAHGSTLQEAITDALWKDEAKRPSLESLRNEIQKDGRDRKISLGEFRILTGACHEGCRAALKKAGLDGSAMKAHEVYKHFPEWGGKLLDILEFERA